MTRQNQCSQKLSKNHISLQNETKQLYFAESKLSLLLHYFMTIKQFYFSFILINVIQMSKESYWEKWTETVAVTLGKKYELLYTKLK